MTHLHIPDGVLPVWLWAAGFAGSAALLALSLWARRGSSPRDLAYQSALGALMLTAMSVPLGPLGFHLSLVGIIGVLLGPAAAFQTVLVVVATLAFLGHGGITVIGLNTLVLGAGTAVARPLFGVLPVRWGAGARAAGATVAGQLVAGALLLAVVAAAGERVETGSMAPHSHDGPGAASLFARWMLPLWALGVVLEAGVAYGLLGFLERVQPALLPGRAREAP
jgi:cobalt/nickel transport system permease protein